MILKNCTKICSLGEGLQKCRFEDLPPGNKTIGIWMAMMTSYLRKFIKSYFNKKSLRINKKYPDYKFGKGTYSSNLKVFNWHEGATLCIGAYCSIADGVQIFLGGEHNVDWVTTYPFSVFWEQAGSYPRPSKNERGR